jgi:hypothetical protein
MVSWYLRLITSTDKMVVNLNIGQVCSEGKGIVLVCS